MIKIKRILCPTDLSPHSGTAVRYASSLARAHEAELMFFHCTNAIDGEERLKAFVLEHSDASESEWRLITATGGDAGEAITMQAHSGMRSAGLRTTAKVENRRWLPKAFCGPQDA